MGKALRIAVFVALAALTACQTPPAAPPEGRAAFGTDPERVVLDGRLFLPPAPAGSEADAADRAALRGPWTPERLTQARTDNELNPFQAFQSVLGANFESGDLPATTALLERVLYAAGYAANAPKDQYARPRPFIADATQATCIEPTTRLRESGSYPSGHASVGWAWGLVLAELIPSHAEAILARAREYGESRLVCGLHYPSDIAAGRMLGGAVVARLHADGEFATMLAAARAELEGRFAPH